MLVLGWLPCVRGMQVRTLAAVAGLALAPSLFVLARGGRDYESPLLVAAMVLGAWAAFAVEDEAEETLSGSPTGLARRRLLRLTALAGATLLFGAALLAVVALEGHGPTAAEAGRRALELAAVGGLSAAAAGVAHRMGWPAAAHGGAIVGAITVLLISALSTRLHQLPSLSGSVQHERWWWAVAAGWGLTAWTWRDPALR